MSSEDFIDIDSMWDYADPHATEQRFREILLHVPESNPRYLELLTQIARAQGMQQKYRRAHQTLDQVERRLDKYPSRAHVRYLLERGRVFKSTGLAEEAQPLFQQALDMANEISEDTYATDANNMLQLIDPPAPPST